MSSNFERTITANPELSSRIQDFLACVYGKPIHLPGPGPAEDAAHPAAQASSGDATPAAEAEAPAAARPPVCTNCGEPAEPCTQKPCVEGCDGSVHTSGGRHGCEGGGGFAAVASPLAPPVPYGHPSIADAVAAKDGPAEADAAPDAEAAK